MVERLTNKLDVLRAEISNAIVTLICKHNTDCIEVFDEFDDKPIIVESFNDSMDTMTLDKIAVIDAENFDVTCSNGYDSTDTFSNKVISIDNLFEMYKWLVENEDDLFE
jgi:tricorn protease-like protein